MKRIVRFSSGHLYWRAYDAPKAIVRVEGAEVRIPIVNSVSFDDKGFPTRIETPWAIFVYVKEG